MAIIFGCLIFLNKSFDELVIELTVGYFESLFYFQTNSGSFRASQTPGVPANEHIGGPDEWSERFL